MLRRGVLCLMNHCSSTPLSALPTPPPFPALPGSAAPVESLRGEVAAVMTNDAMEATRVLVGLLAQANTLLKKKKKAIEIKQPPPPARQLRPPSWAVEFKRQLLAVLDKAIMKQHK